MGKKVKLTILICFIILLGLGLCFVIKSVGLDNLSTIKNLLNDNIYGAIIYVTLLAMQVVFVPINSMILIIPAIMAFGAFKAFLLSLLALLIGSCISYYIGKIFGTSLIKFFAGTAQVEKWQNALSKNGKFVLPILLLIPIFPDELICMLAGIARLKFGYFFLVSLITRIIDLSCICFIGAVLPMHGWWLVLWGCLIALCTLLAIYLGRNQEKLQSKVMNFINKNLKRKKHKQNNE
ncbi:MAG: TVP38/TMEM64 family protein [Clostridia bacterium]|nr:TVP38/TMEM64 family protein [Clostridia bacterium]